METHLPINIESPLRSDVSEELLKLLRGLNGRSEQANAPVEKDTRDEKSAPRKFYGGSQPFCWYEHTHRGQDWIADIPLPESRPTSPSFDEDSVNGARIDNESCTALEKYPPQNQTWGYLYESSFRHRSEELSFMSDAITRETGTAWSIPEDGRSGLTLSLRGLGLEIRQDGSESTGGITDQNFAQIMWHGRDSEDSKLRAKILSALGVIGRFDKVLHKAYGRQFTITDYDPWNGEFLTYRLGKTITGWFDDQLEKTLGESWGRTSWLSQDRKVMSRINGSKPKEIFRPLCLLKGRTEGDQAFRSQQMAVFNTAPWRRLIYIQGLASMPAETSHGVGLPGCPYLDGRTDWASNVYARHRTPRISQAIKSHLSCERTPGNASSNPYSQYGESFPLQIVFYEKLDEERMENRYISQWKIGQLFDNSGDGNNPLCLRRSCFTVTTVSLPSCEYGNITYLRSLVEQDLDPFYTVLVLVPEGFQIQKPGDDPSSVQKDLPTYGLGERTAIQAELSYIVQCLEQVIERWIELDQYLGSLLVEDFMDPKQYSTLLFDDENFTRSRKYFWAIGCLNEFIISVADNVKQWDMYHEGRIKNILDGRNATAVLNAASVLPPKEFVERNWRKYIVASGEWEMNLFSDVVKRGNNHRETLVNLQAQFERKLETVKALRDGLFNASALVESRASTRLGENVKLLTYVSIFYLPLAFCASTWAIPNIDSSSTRTPFVVTAILVGAVTYAIVLNINSISGGITASYSGTRDKMVREMQQESGWWKDAGTRFEEFKPTPERRVPTEWLIPVYAFVRMVKWRRKQQHEIQLHSEITGSGKENAVINHKEVSYISNTPKDPNVGLLSRIRGRRWKTENTSV